MSRLQQRFQALAQKGEKALICFVTAGDPSPETTVNIVEALVQADVDAIEIGIPFSDPLADGPSIQASSMRALSKGMTTKKTLNIVAEIRSRCPDVPLILMTYYNPILQFGLEAYTKAAKEAGADAHIVTDLTPEEAEEWKTLSNQNGLDTIFLLAPTSTHDRIEVVAKMASGFIYCVSRTGVTGARKEIPAELPEVVRTIKAESSQPVCVGFGVSAQEHVQQISEFADGVVVGSALVDLIHDNREASNLTTLVYDFVANLKAGTRQ